MVRDIKATADALFQVFPASDVYSVFDIIDWSVTLDSSWTPFAQMTMTLPLDVELADIIDPVNTATTADLVIFIARDLTTPTEQQAQFRFSVRGVTRNHTAQTMTVRAASAEILAESFAWSSATPELFPAGTPVTWVVDSVLARIGGNLDAAASAPTSATIPEDLTWEAGTTATQILQAVVDPTGLKIIADAEQRWLLVDPTLPVTTGPTAPRLYPLADVIELEERADLDAGNYADNVVMVYEWQDAAGTTQRRVTSAESPALDPTWHVEHVDSRYPGPGAAGALQTRLRQWGRERTFRILWDLELRPGIVAMLEDADGTITQGRVHSVTYQEDGTMTVVSAVEPYDTGWLDLASKLVSPATGGSLWCRRVGSVVQLVGNVVGSFVDTSGANIAGPGAVPADCRPSSPDGEIATGPAHMTSGYLADTLVRSDGSIAYWMRSGQTARSRVQFSITYQAL